MTAHACAKAPFPQGGQVGIVAQFDGNVEMIFQLFFEGHIAPAGDIGGGVDDAGAGVDGPGGGGADGAHGAVIGPDARHQIAEAVQRGAGAAGADALVAHRFTAARGEEGCAQACAADIYGQVVVRHSVNYNVT